MVFQYATTFLAGSGLTALATTIYERYEMGKERKQAYFNKLILRPELFRYLTGLTEMYDSLIDLRELRRAGKVMLFVDGKAKTIKSEVELFSQVSPKIKETEEQRKQLRESGVYFLVPRKLQMAINNLWWNLPKYPSVTDAAIKKYEVLMEELRECLAKELGID